MYKFEMLLNTLTSTAISLYCSKKVFQMPQVLVNFLELRFFMLTAFQLHIFDAKQRDLDFFLSSNRYRDISC